MNYTEKGFLLRQMIINCLIKDYLIFLQAMTNSILLVTLIILSKSIFANGNNQLHIGGILN